MQTLVQRIIFIYLADNALVKEEHITMNEVQWGAQLADIKDVNYRNTLAIASLIELLTEKKIITQGEFSEKSRSLDLLAERIGQLSH